MEVQKMKLSLPANISKLRKEHSMTQEQLAEALGVTFAAVSKWERGGSHTCQEKTGRHTYCAPPCFFIKYAVR